jgi:hypothetical protein
MGRSRKVVAAVLASVSLAASIATPIAAAQPPPQQSGLINVSVGDITLQDINVGVAAQVVAGVCGINVGPVAVLATQVVRNGGTATGECPATGGTFTFSQD